eukprot:g10939.t1
MGPVHLARFCSHRKAAAATAAAAGAAVVEPLLLLLILSLVLSVLPLTAEAALDQETLELVWYDEFVGGSVDWDKWVVDEGDGCDINLCDWGNGERQYYRTENAAVAGGRLGITVKDEVYSSRFYTSSKITTKNKFSFRFGRAEARIRLPPGGQGLWPAFWMMPQDNAYGSWSASGEIDIFESRNNFTEVVNNLHYGNAFPNNTNINGECFLDVPIGTLEEYHTYAVECSDEVTRAFGGNDDFVGSGPVDDSILPARMEVDYVRVYQSPEMFEDDGGGNGDGSRSVYLRDATGGGSRQGVEIWGDEFNGTELTAGGWELASGEVCLGAEALCESEVQVFYDEDDVTITVGEGVLGVTADARGSATVNAAGVVTSARSGLLHTKDGFSFTYGRLEANLSAPTLAGVVSTVSLLAADTSSANIGQVEVVAVENGRITGGLWNSDGNHSCFTTGYDFEGSAFHTFAVEWTEDRIRWYAGGRQYCEVTSSDVAGYDEEGAWPFGTEMFVSVGVSVGRGVGGEGVAVNSSLLPATLQVGAVRAHQFSDMDAAMEEVASAVGMYVREGNLTWQDEFDGVSLDAASQEEAGEGVMGLEYWWEHYEGDGCEMNICGFGNGEAQWYRKENTAVRDGKLVVTAKAEAYAGNIYTSAKLSTNATVVVSYGRIETRVKLPKAQGLWPSIWMLPQNSPYGGWASGGAINILEARNEMSRAHGQLHFGGAFPDVETLDLSEGGHCYSDLHDDLSDDYHVYALEWEADSMRWYVDDVLFCDRQYWYSRPGPGEDDYPFPAPFDTGFHLIMNVAVGGSFTGGPIDEDALAENPEMLVDYVRVYQLEGQSIFVAEPPPDSSSGNGGNPLSVVTAVSVLVVLGVLFSMCILINCVAKRKSKKAAARAAAAGGAGVRDNPNILTYESFNSENTDFTTPVGGGLGKSGSSSRLKFLGARQRASEKFAADDDISGGGGTWGPRDSSLARTASPPHRGAVGTALPVIGGGGSGGAGLRGTGNRGAVRGRGGGGGDTESPLWGRRTGVDERRSDVTPGRLRQEQRENGGGMRHPRPASGTIPEDWVAEGEEGSEAGAASGSGGRAVAAAAGGGGGGTALSARSGARARAEAGTGDRAAGRTFSCGRSPARISSSADVAIEEAIALSAVAAASALDNESSVASPSNNGGAGGFRADDARREDGVWMGGASTVGSARHAGKREYVGSDGVSSVGSHDSELPPSMHGLRLDTTAMDEVDVDDRGLPSYEEAVAAAPYEWRPPSGGHVPRAREPRLERAADTLRRMADVLERQVDHPPAGVRRPLEGIYRARKGSAGLERTPIFPRRASCFLWSSITAGGCASEQ